MRARRCRHDRRGSEIPSSPSSRILNIFVYLQITLRGRVEPVGGVKEKVLGAHRAGMKKVILPWANRKDVDHDVPREVKDDMQFFFVKTVSEGLEAAFGKGNVPWRQSRAGHLIESRL